MIHRKPPRLVTLILGCCLATLSTNASAQSATALLSAPAAVDPLASVDPELRPAAQQLQAMIASFPPFTESLLPKLRSRQQGPETTRLPDVPVAERRIAGPAGAPDLTLYVVNAKAGGSRPGILHTHGGGYILGTARSDVRNLQELAKATNCVIVSVEYRLAPETRVSGSVEDNYAGLLWMHAHAAELGVDPSRIAVMGESAGGGHAALLALAARDRREVPIVFQMLVYPMLDDRTGSSRAVAPHIGTIGWRAAENRFGWHAFLGQAPGGPNVPRSAVPARVADLRGLPPTFIGVGSIDLFVDEDIEYARRLIASGVPTELLVVPGAFHGFDSTAGENRRRQAVQPSQDWRAATRLCRGQASEVRLRQEPDLTPQRRRAPGGFS
jgi:acetyl esterase/lipase